jgi:hypothetical protein
MYSTVVADFVFSTLIRGSGLRWAIGANLPEVGIADPRCMSTQLTWTEKVDISTHSGESPRKCLNTTLIIALFSCICKYTFPVNVQFVIIKDVEMIYIRKLIKILGEYCHHSVYPSTMSFTFHLKSLFLSRGKKKR